MFLIAQTFPSTTDLRIWFFRLLRIRRSGLDRLHEVSEPDTGARLPSLPALFPPKKKHDAWLSSPVAWSTDIQAQSLETKLRPCRGVGRQCFARAG